MSEKKKPIKNKVYDKIILTSHKYDEATAKSLNPMLDTNYLSFAFIDRKHRPNDDLKTVETSHDINCIDVNGKLGIHFIFRHRNSSVRFNNQLIIDKVNEQLGAPAKKEKKEERK